jgi:hypothetical protein
MSVQPNSVEIELCKVFKCVHRGEPFNRIDGCCSYPGKTTVFVCNLPFGKCTIQRYSDSQPEQLCQACLYRQPTAES